MGNTDYTDITTTGTVYRVTYSYDSSTCTTSSSADGSFTWTIRVPPPKTYFVKVPKHWKKSRIAGFAGLVNEETRTGWRVTALVQIKQIYDKQAVMLTMDKFKTMLLERASAEDAAKINKWFAKK